MTGLVGKNQSDILTYPNVPRTLGIIVSQGMATLHELDTVYGSEDVYDMLEIIFVDAYNKAKAQQDAELNS